MKKAVFAYEKLLLCYNQGSRKGNRLCLAVARCADPAAVRYGSRFPSPCPAGGPQQITASLTSLSSIILMPVSFTNSGEQEADN
jgi:hypothetical protein